MVSAHLVVMALACPAVGVLAIDALRYTLIQEIVDNTRISRVVDIDVQFTLSIYLTSCINRIEFENELQSQN